MGLILEEELKNIEGNSMKMKLIENWTRYEAENEIIGKEEDRKLIEDFQALQDKSPYCSLVPFIKLKKSSLISMILSKSFLLALSSPSYGGDRRTYSVSLTIASVLFSLSPLLQDYFSLHLKGY
jgi:hypothetical protein